jgi:lipid A disaccharide synthetase
MSEPLFKRKGALKVAMVAGEASGDLLAAHLMEALQARHADIEFAGIGGPRMEARGFVSHAPQSRLAVMGYAEVSSACRSYCVSAARCVTDCWLKSRMSSSAWMRLTSIWRWKPH